MGGQLSSFSGKSIKKNPQVKAHLNAQVKGEEEQGLPSDRIMVGGFSQV